MAERKKYHLNQVGIRMVRERTLYSQEPIHTPEAAVKLISKAIADYDREVVAVVNMQTDGKPININISSIGTLNQAPVNPREAVKASILSNAASVIVIHNHPSGHLQPSREDIVITDRLLKAYELMGISVLDHIIFDGHDHYYSFMEQGIRAVDELHYSTDIDEVRGRLKNSRSIAERLQELKETAGAVTEEKRPVRRNEVSL